MKFVTRWYTGRNPAALKAGQEVQVKSLISLVILLFPMAEFSGAFPTAQETSSSPKIWNFDTDRAGALPPNFLVGTLVDGRLAGQWHVIDMKKSLDLIADLDRREHQRIQKVLQTLDPPSPPHVIAQMKNQAFEQDYHVVLIQGTASDDIDLSVSILPVAGKGDMGGGLIWRAQDHQNYYITRANPLEQNIRFYRVVKGVRYKLANFDHIISVDTWHIFRVVTRGNHFQIYFDGQKVLDVQDETFQSGQIGLWTKADAVTYFDDLQLSVGK